MDEPLPRHPRAAPGWTLRQVGDEWLLHAGADERVHVLNLTTARVWTHCTGRASPAAIAQALRDVFRPAPEEDVEAQVRAIIDRLAAAGLVAP